MTPVAKKQTEYELEGPDASGRGVYDEKGFIVKQGSLARRELRASAQKYIAEKQRQLLSEGILEENGKSLRFTKDYLFSSPSGASTLVILGYSSNGWDDWKLPDGRSLSQVERVSREEGDELLTAAKRQAILDRQQKLINEEAVPPQVGS